LALKPLQRLFFMWLASRYYVWSELSSIGFVKSLWMLGRMLKCNFMEIVWLIRYCAPDQEICVYFRDSFKQFGAGQVMEFLHWIKITNLRPLSRKRSRASKVSSSSFKKLLLTPRRAFWEFWPRMSSIRQLIWHLRSLPICSMLIAAMFFGSQKICRSCQILMK
ncbi:MAG: hypothetical protein ACD_2C00074G0002, partial [uncultured bacterium (gcode 4)]